jgi:Tape measure protein
MIASLMVEIGADPNALYSFFDSAVDQGQAAGARAGNAFSRALTAPIFRATNDIRAMGYQIGSSLDLATSAFGMKTAAEFGRIRNQLTMIGGDANKAAKEFDKLIRLADTTSFNNDDIATLSVKVAADKGSVSELSGQVETYLDAAIAGGVKNVDLEPFMTNIFQMFNKENGAVGRVDARQMRNRAPLMINAFAQAMGVTNEEVVKQLETMSGKEFRALFETVAKNNKGAAIAAGARNPFEVAQNMVSSMNTAMEPTGRALNAVVTPIVSVGNTAIQVYGRINTLSGGLVGMVAVGGLAIIAIRAVQSSTRTATSTLFGLKFALDAMAASAQNAAVKSVGSGLTQNIGNVGSGLTGAGASATASAFSKAGIKAFAQNAGKMALSGLKTSWPALVAGIADIGINAYADNYMEGKNQAVAKNTGGGIGWGGAIGGIIGGIVGTVALPGVGTVAGAAWGAGIGAGLGGAGAGGYTAATYKDGKTGEAADKLASAADDLSDAAKDLKFESWGGGKRTDAIANALSFEYALARGI